MDEYHLKNMGQVFVHGSQNHGASIRTVDEYPLKKDGASIRSVDEYPLQHMGQGNVRGV